MGSGILNNPLNIPYPDIQMLEREGVEPRVCESYVGKLYLNSHLKSIDKMFRGPVTFDHIRMVGQDIALMEWAGKHFKFCESDPPAADIISAQLWAAYWHTQVMTFRPFINEILHRQWSDVTLEHARKGINALIKSTGAFHGLVEGERPIITNVFGTAHT